MENIQRKSVISLLTLSSDIISCVIMSRLRQNDLLAFSMACSKLRKIFLNLSSSFEKKKSRFRQGVMASVLRSGKVNQLRWLHEVLKYPKLEKFIEDEKTMKHAVQCKLSNSIFF